MFSRDPAHSGLVSVKTFGFLLSILVSFLCRRVAMPSSLKDAASRT